jgi:hypothetical protein
MVNNDILKENNMKINIVQAIAKSVTGKLFKVAAVDADKFDNIEEYREYLRNKLNSLAVGSMRVESIRFVYEEQDS